MSRQRTISDSFWRDPSISGLSQEDRATLVYLLTSPSSNITGVYAIVLRVAGAEMGWTEEQMLVVIKRLQKKGLILFRQESGWLWVKIWWQHNSLRAAFAGKMRENTLKQILAMPSEWLDDYLAELAAQGIHVPPPPQRRPGAAPGSPHRHPDAAPPPNSTFTFTGSSPRRRVGEHLAGLRAAITPQPESSKG